jgi:3-oxoacyl-[acyl-carrier protein] reductase
MPDFGRGRMLDGEMEPSSLAGRVALVTGAGRRVGIGAAVGARLRARGARVMLHSWSRHDADQPWGADPEGPDAVLRELGGPGTDLDHVQLDLADPDSPAELAERTIERFGALDLLVVNHARSSEQDLAALTAAELDLSWAVNARAPLLLVQAYAARHDDRRSPGRIVLFTSGQHLGPTPGELPYVAAKGALLQLTASLADALADRGITVNCLNPGPVDTGYADPAAHRQVAGAFPSGRWTTPAEIAEVVAWLCGPASQPITGQVLNAESGFRRYLERVPAPGP